MYGPNERGPCIATKLVFAASEERNQRRNPLPTGNTGFPRPPSAAYARPPKAHSETGFVEIAADDFARRFSLRAANLMWLLGAGSSAAAGIPTAGDMIWEFKQTFYISQRRASPKLVADLSNPAIRAQLQAHVDSAGKLPAAGAADEYAALFEAVYPAEADRRAYLDSKMAGAKPSYGHLVLATLMRAQLARLVWTTNFDPLIADACAKGL
ncbi:MAG TPA: hypothetical protein VHZ55_29635 [Bryobacteraceae bacterium]|jgi:hypothetical protein|nr:hypothetical protein [Bryobacteraceae bacterium]